MNTALQPLRETCGAQAEFFSKLFSRCGHTFRSGTSFPQPVQPCRSEAINTRALTVCGKTRVGTRPRLSKRRSSPKRHWEGHDFSSFDQIEEVQVVGPGPLAFILSVFTTHSKHVILSGAGTSRSEAPAESKDPYTLSGGKDALGNFPVRPVFPPIYCKGNNRRGRVPPSPLVS